MMAYNEYLKTSHWENTRLEKIRRAKYKCQLCRKDGLFDVHHLRYRDEKGSILFREDLKEDLVCLCPTCHTTVHCFLEELEKSIPVGLLLFVQGMTTEEASFTLQDYIAYVGAKYWPNDVHYYEYKDYQDVPEIINEIACKRLCYLARFAHLL